MHYRAEAEAITLVRFDLDVRSPPPGRPGVAVLLKSQNRPGRKRGFEDMAAA